MRRLISLFTLILTFHFSSAQDMIITVDNDTLECKITRLTEEFIHFSVFDKSGILLMRSRLPLSQVHSYKQGPYTTNEPTQPIPLEEEDSDFLNLFEPAKFRLSANGGYTYQFGGYRGLPTSYKRQMQSLWNLGGELHYFLSENLGLGLKYNHIFTEANEDFEPPFSTVFGFSRLRNERVRFSYFGPSLLYRNLLYDDQSINYFFSIGMIRYRTDLVGDGIPFYQEGETFGIAFGLIYDFILTRNFGVGLGLEINLAWLSEIDDNGTVRSADFDISRADLTLGFRWFK